jgi:hypothetical protein
MMRGRSRFAACELVVVGQPRQYRPRMRVVDFALREAQRISGATVETVPEKVCWPTHRYRVAALPGRSVYTGVVGGGSY